jgi:HSP20 family molecular chaperone IbpA
VPRRPAIRAAELPAEVDTTSNAVKATCDQGVLTIMLPTPAA